MVWARAVTAAGERGRRATWCRRGLAVAAGVLAALAGMARAEPPAAPPGAEKVQHIVIVYLENHSFDNLYGRFPGADGIDNAGTAAAQTDEDGRPYPHLPPVLNPLERPPRPDPRFPQDLPNGPFLIDASVPNDQRVPDPLHRFYQHQEQIHGGRNDRFVAASNAGAMTMGVHDLRGTALYGYAERFTLLDRFFQAAFGGSLLNHLWLVCACTPSYPDAPQELRAVLDGSGKLLRDGVYSPDGFVINNVFPQGGPYPQGIRDVKPLVPPQHLPTIGERLSAKGVSWAWYAGGWNASLAGGRPVSIVVPFLYFAPYGPGTPGRREHLRDEADLVQAIASDRLPAVAFFKPAAKDDQHPGYTDLLTGDRHAGDLIASIEHSPAWAGTVIVVTYDEYGGYWDHVPPPPGDRWGPGTRIPAILISPFARRGAVDHTVYDTTSILKMIESRFALEPLGTRDAQANDLLRALDFSGPAAAR